MTSSIFAAGLADSCLQVLIGFGRSPRSVVSTNRARISWRLPSAPCEGREVDQDICDVANASLSGRLGCSETFVHSGDSLRPFREETPFREGSHQCAASNPPFGTKITIKSLDILSRYELAAPNGRRPTPRPPDVLLLEQNVRMLKPGQRSACNRGSVSDPIWAADSLYSRLASSSYPLGSCD